MPVVEKKSRAVQRHRRVATRYAEWLRKNPNAGKRARIQKLDQISDYEFINDSKLGR